MSTPERFMSPVRSTDGDEEPLQLEGRYSPRTSRRASRGDDTASRSDAASHHEPILFSSSHRVDSEVDQAFREDVIPAHKKKPGKLWRTLFKILRPDFLLDHLDWKSFQIVSRTWVCIFFNILMLVIKRFEHYVGVTAYLGMILSVIEVSGGISYAHSFYTSLADLVFIMFAFTCATIGHAISWSIRGRPTAESLMQELVEEGVCKVGDAACFLHQIHLGRYLRTKCTVMMFFAIFSSLFITGYLSQSTRLLLVPQILSSITVLIMGLYLNMTPQFAPWTYGRAIVLPFGLALCARVVTSLFWFPVTSNYKFLSIVNGAFVSTTTILRDNIGQLEDMKPSSDEFVTMAAQIPGKVNGALAKFALLELEGLLCRGEVCYSRFDPGDLGEFRALARMLAGSLYGFSFFFDEIVEKRNLILGRLDAASNQEAEKEEDEGNIEPVSSLRQRPVTSRQSQAPNLVPIERRHTLSQIDKDRRKNKWFDSKLTRVYAPAGHFEDRRLDAALELDWDGMHIEELDDIYPNIISHYKEISDALIALLEAVNKWSATANNFRVAQMLFPPWRKKHKRLQAENAALLEEALNRMLDANQEKDNKFEEWAEFYNKKQISRSPQHFINILSIDAFHGCTIRRLVGVSTRIARYCLFLDEHQPKPRIIYPFMRLRSKSPRFESEYLMSSAVGTDAADQSYTMFETGENVQRRNPDSTPPRNVYHLIGRQIMRGISFMRDSKVKYCIKRATFTLLTSLTYCTRTTLMFSYSYRVVWVPIMVALTLSFQALDGVYGFFAKLYFTFFGCLIGMVVWYIGVGSERGNPYGIAAALGALFVFLGYFRHFNTHKVPMGAIILCVTVTIVTGTSWNDSKMMPLDVELRWGWPLAWKRFVCVVVGISIAFIGTILPKPITAKKNIRVMISASLEQLGDIQSNLSNFGLQRERDRNVRIAPRQDPTRVKLRRVGATINVASQLASRLDFEPPLGGLWPKHRYMLLLKLVSELNHILGSAHFLLDNIEDTSQMPSVLQLMGWTNIELMSSMYSVLIMGSRSLDMGRPLPSVTPGHLSEIYSRILKQRFEIDLRKLNEQSAEELIKKRYVDHDGRTSLALVIVMHMMFTRIDACLRLIKGLVGEIYGVDLAVFNYDPEIGYEEFITDEIAVH